MKNRKPVHDNWATPKYLYDYLDNKYHFDFDPCPLCEAEIIPGSKNDGLAKKWGNSNFINPPYSRDLKPKFISKAVEESKRGGLCVMLIPVSTSTESFHRDIVPYANEICFIKGRVAFEGINSKGEKVNTKCGMHDSMIVIFDITHKTDLNITTLDLKELKNRDKQLELF